MHLFITKTDGWNLPDGRGVDRDLSARAGLIEGLPFFVDSDGKYDEHLNGWLRWLSAKSPSHNTWLAYARDVDRYIRFLDEIADTRTDLPRNWLASTNDSIGAYKYVRQRAPGGALLVAASTWNRELAALKSLFTYAQEKGLVSAIPFAGSAPDSPNLPTGGGVNVTAELTSRFISKTRHPLPKYLSAQQYRDFKKVGLGGRRLNPIADAQEDPNTRYVYDPHFRGRNTIRNALFADLLVTTGMRRSEAGSLLIWETRPSSIAQPKHLTTQQSSKDDDSIVFNDVEIQLAAAVCKGRVNPRPVYVPRRVYRRLVRYVERQRAHAVAIRCGASGRGPYALPARALPIEQDSNGRLRLVGASRPIEIDRIDVPTRRRLVATAEGTPLGPAQIFVGEGGLPVSCGLWNETFAAASARCRKVLDWTFDVRPHDLRHTYAVNMLHHLVEVLLQTTDVREFRRNFPFAAHERIARNPIHVLMRRLGHVQVESTFIYLQFLDEVQDLAAEASVLWAAETDTGSEDDE